MNKEAFLASMAISKTPVKISTERFLEIDGRVRTALKQDPQLIELVADIARKTSIRSRHVITPFLLDEDQCPEGVEDIFTPANFCPSPKKRIQFWIDVAIPMAVEVAQKALDEWDKPKDQISHIIAVSSTGSYQPGIEHVVIEKLGLSPDCQKVGVYGGGCTSGICALRLARDAVLAGATGVLVVGSEVSSILYDPVAMDTTHLNASALFGDGAAAAIIAPEGQWKFEKAGNSMVPDTSHMMYTGPEFHSPGVNGIEFFLHPEIGPSVARFFKDDKGFEILSDILNHTKTHPAFAVHLGGPRTYKMLSALIKLGWPDDVLRISLDTLQQNGNMVSASIFHVLSRTLAEVENDNIILMAVGTGVSIEWGWISKKF